jgi:long-chain acyl-CoA synthetase
MDNVRKMLIEDL